MSTPSAAARIQRALYTSLGVAALAYTLLGIPSAVGQFGAFVPGFGAGAYVICSLLSTSLAVLGPFAPLRLLSGIATAHCIAFALTLALWFPLMTAPSVPGLAPPWTFDVVTIAASAAAIAWHRAAAWVYLVAVAVATGFVTYVSSPELGWLNAAHDLVYALSFSVIVVAIIQVSRTAGHRLDTVAASARAEASREARESSARQQRMRLNALIHDRVLSVLLAAARANSDRDGVREGARTALLALAPADERDRIGADEVAARIRSAAGGMPVEWDVSVAPGVSVPAEAAAALVEAAAEALRNSEKHADPERVGVDRRVTLRMLHDDLSIVVEDDGVGFSLRRLAPDRLGVRVSIIDRMRAAGGAAHITAAPGRGTRVELRWPVGEAP